jgi:transposase
MDTQVRTKVVGIDVSKDSLAACHRVEEKALHLETDNNKVGFKKLVKCCGTESLYVMEATGVQALEGRQQVCCCCLPVALRI